MDPDHLADALASADAHLTLDIPLELAAALRSLLTDRESRIAQLEGLLHTATLEAANANKRCERLAGFSFVPDEDEAYCAEVRRGAPDLDVPAWLHTLRTIGAL